MTSAFREQAEWIGRTGGLAAVLALPAELAPGVPAVVLMNPGTLHRVGVSRFNVRLARHLATAGHPVIRFDFSGLGDSEPRDDGLAFRESAVEEIREASDHLLAVAGDRPLVLCGLCTGAAMSFEAAVADPRVVGAVLIEGYAFPTLEHRLRRWWPEVTSLDSWIGLLTGRTFVRPALRRLVRRVRGDDREEEARSRSAVFAYELPTREHVRHGLLAMLGRDVRLLQVFGGGAHHYYNYRRQFLDAFPDIDFRGLMELEHVPDADHTFSASDHQQWLVERIARWLAPSGRPPRAPAPPRVARSGAATPVPAAR